MRARLLLLAALLAGGCAPAAPPPPPAPPPASRIPAEPAPAAPSVLVLERPVPEQAPDARGLEVARRMEMRSTAYCLRGHMRTGVRTRDGMAAVDPSVVPLGSVLRVSHPDGRPLGLFVAMDTGGAVRGNKIDLYMDSCAEARAWGIRPVVVEVIAIGWGR